MSIICHKVLLISEAPIAKNSGGISQTLFNLFDGYPKDKFMGLCSEEDMISWSANEKNDLYVIGFKKRLLQGVKNRVGFLINPLIKYLNLSFLNLNPEQYSLIEKFKPSIIIICANGPEGLIIGSKITRKYKIPFMIYFMDDWFSSRNLTWFNGDLQEIVKHSLKNSSGWIMISSYLQEILEKRYNIKKRTIIAHNPVTIWNNYTEIEEDAIGLRIAYAGSIWPMHLDAFRIVAVACSLLRKRGIKAYLHMLGPNVFYENNKNLFLEEEIIYEGKVSYDLLYPALEPYDLLLVCSSFKEEHAPFSVSSVQTKITDYMNTGKPILSVGPDYSACNRYIKSNNIGFTFEINDPNKLADFLIEVQEDMNKKRTYVENSKKLIQTTYDKEIVQQKLYQFINETE